MKNKAAEQEGHGEQEQQIFKAREKDLFDTYAESGIFIWVFPITYWTDGKIEKRVFAWEIEFNDGKCESKGQNGDADSFATYQDAKMDAMLHIVKKYVKEVQDGAKIDTSKLHQTFNTPSQPSGTGEEIKVGDKVITWVLDYDRDSLTKIGEEGEKELTQQKVYDKDQFKKPENPFGESPHRDSEDLLKAKLDASRIHIETLQLQIKHLQNEINDKQRSINWAGDVIGSKDVKILELKETIAQQNIKELAEGFHAMIAIQKARIKELEAKLDFLTK